MQRRRPTVRVTCSVALLIHCFAVGLTAAAASSDSGNIAGQNEPENAHSFIQPNDGSGDTTMNETPQHYDIEEGSTAIPIDSQGEQTGNRVKTGRDSRHYNLEEMMSKDDLAESSLATQSTTGLPHNNIGEGMKKPRKKYYNRPLPYNQIVLTRVPLAVDKSEPSYEDHLAIDEETKTLHRKLKNAKVLMLESTTILASNRPEIVKLIKKTVKALKKMELDTHEIRRIELVIHSFRLTASDKVKSLRSTILKIRGAIDGIHRQIYLLKQIPCVIPKSSTDEPLQRMIRLNIRRTVLHFQNFLHNFRSLVDTAVQHTRQAGDEPFWRFYGEKMESFASKILPRLDKLLRLHKEIEEALNGCKNSFKRARLADKELYSIRERLDALEKNEPILHANQLANAKPSEQELRNPLLAPTATPLNNAFRSPMP